jgi:hypothetical protein
MRHGTKACKAAQEESGSRRAGETARGDIYARPTQGKRASRDQDAMGERWKDKMKRRRDPDWIDDREKIGGKFPNRVSLPEFAWVHPNLLKLILDDFIDVSMFGLVERLQAAANDPAADLQQLRRTVNTIAAEMLRPPPERPNLKSKETQQILKDAVKWLPRAAELCQEILTYATWGRPRGMVKHHRVAFDLITEDIRAGKKRNWERVYEHQDVKPHIMKSRTVDGRKRLKRQLRNTVNQYIRRLTRAMEFLYKSDQKLPKA